MSGGTPNTESGGTPLALWRQQNEGRSFSFAVDEAGRCEAITTPTDLDWLNTSDRLHRCGKASGHAGRHECSDYGYTIKWAIARAIIAKGVNGAPSHNPPHPHEFALATKALDAIGFDTLHAELEAAKGRLAPQIDQTTLYNECRTTGWDPGLENSLAEELAHIHEEVSEAFKAWRVWRDASVHYEGEKPVGVPIEFADVLIGLFYNAEVLGFDLWEAVRIKHEYNLTRNYVAEGRQLHVEPGRAAVSNEPTKETK